MRITFFRLKGYIKVLNGMGLDEVIIDFSKFKNRIVLVQGENGCSKSTIIAAMSPNPDTSDSFRTDVIVDSLGNRQIIEYPAEKEIHYMGTDECGNDVFYQILIKSIVNESKTTRTTKAFISKNGEELNPNGNVSSFKEIRDSMLGIDPTYLDLSSVSSENRGIVDMIPSDRRKYMAAYIGSLDTYNNIFKVISKKVSSLKSYMNTLNAKIYELGDENEMRLKLMQLETSLKDKNKKRDDLLKELADAEATVRLIDPDNKMQDLYTSISERLEGFISEMKKNKAMVESLSKQLSIDYETSDIGRIIDDTNESIKSHEAGVTEKKNRITTLMSLNEATLQKIESDRSILNGIEMDKIQDNIETTVNGIKAEIESYERRLSESDIAILNSTSIDELTDLRDTFDMFQREIAIAEDMHTDDLFQLAVDSSNGYQSKNSLQNTITRLSSSIAKNETRIEETEEKAKKIADDLAKLKEFNNMRPKDCHIDDCPYIKNYISLVNKVGSKADIDKCYQLIEKLKKEIARWSADVDNAIKINDISVVIGKALNMICPKKTILRKFKAISYMANPDNVKKLIKAHYRFPDFKVVTDIIEKYYMYEELKKAKEQLVGLEGDLKIYRNNKSLSEKLNSSIEAGELEYSNREEEIKTLTKDYAFISSIIVELKAKVDKLLELQNGISEIARIDDEINKLREEFNSVKDKIRLVKEKIDSLNEVKNSIANIESEIGPLDNMINQIKFDLSNIINYQAEFKDSSDRYEKMVFIRNACSPGNGLGIQSEYIKRYMNDIIIDCNKMLGYMFNGQIQLDVPVIDEKHFSIPFIGPNGIVVPDISAGSTAQKCMIGLVFSCVAMMKSSSRYNIVRLDEIDGGLDPQNRIIFINVLNSILDFMGTDQCVICSHNTEFDTESTTRLICTHAGIRIEQ